MNGDSHIRRAVKADAAELARLLTRLGYPLSEEDVKAVWSEWEAEGNFALVVEEGYSLLGAVTLHRTFVLHRPKPIGRITSLVVDPAVRGRGLGRALTLAAEQAMIEAGCGLLEVTSHKRRDEAHAFYKHMDYEETSYRFMKAFS